MKVLALSDGKYSIACLHLMQDELACAIYADTSFSYPEQHTMIAYAETLIQVHRVVVDRAKNHREYGLPADVVPVEWTTRGQARTGPELIFCVSASCSISSSVREDRITTILTSTRGALLE